MFFRGWFLSILLVVSQKSLFVTAFGSYSRIGQHELSTIRSISWGHDDSKKFLSSTVVRRSKNQKTSFRLNTSSSLALSSLVGGANSSQLFGPAIVKTFHTSGVQKMLELGVIMSFGFFLRNKLDAKAVNAVLLNALIPAVILSSLSSLQLSFDLGLIVVSGALLTVIQIVSGNMASRFVIPPQNNNDDEEEHHHKVSGRTSAIQLGTMATAASVFSFTREFVGAKYVGYAALADVPNKVYSLLLIPYAMRSRAGIVRDKRKEKRSKKQTMKAILSDPFNLAIGCGLSLAAMRRPVSQLGFFGKAITNLAQAQTAILFLLIGLKLKIGKGNDNEEDNPIRLCIRLLLARHGFVGLFVSLFMALFLRGATESTAALKLTSVLSSNAACSIICFGQMAKVVSAALSSKGIEQQDDDGDNNKDFYDLDLAFDIVAISYPLTILLNTITCLAGPSYVNNLPFISLGFIALSGFLNAMEKRISK